MLCECTASSTPKLVSNLVRQYLSDDEYSKLQHALIEKPDQVT